MASDRLNSCGFGGSQTFLTGGEGRRERERGFRLLAVHANIPTMNNLALLSFLSHFNMLLFYELHEIYIKQTHY